MKQSFFIFLLFLLLSTFVYAEETDPFLIVPGVSIGLITEKTTEIDLIDAYGVENVRSTVTLNDQKETRSETILFPFDAMRKLLIIWKNGNSNEGPALIRITEPRSLWHTAEGISQGTSLVELEIMNGTFFHLTGFKLENPGVVTDCGYGNLKYLGYLEPDVEGIKGQSIILKLDQPTAVYDRVTKEEYASICVDGVFKSDNSIIERLNPKVYQIEVLFPK